MGAGQVRHAENTPRGDITNNPNDAKYSSLPSSFAPPLIGDQRDLDAYISNPALRKQTKKAFRCGQPSLDTAAHSSFTSASLALAPLGRSLTVGTGQEEHAKNTPQGDITKDLNDDKYSSLPLSFVPPFIGDQGDLDAYISNTALCQPTKKLT